MLTETLYNIKNSNTTLIESSGCGCNGGMNNIEIQTSNVCDCTKSVHQAYYNLMIETFSNIDFWSSQIEVCQKLKQYIDEIIRLDFTLSSSVVNPYADCTCVQNDSQTKYKTYLQNLSRALQYIINDDMSGNKNFIKTSFNNFAVYLYENMQW